LFFFVTLSKFSWITNCDSSCKPIGQLDLVENTKAGLKSARKNGRVGGRPAIMTDEKLRTAKAMLKDTENYPFISDIIKTLRIGRTTFYRHFPPEKIQKIRQGS